MKTPQFTPGPWKLNENRSNDFLITITTSNETENVCLVYRQPLRQLAKANARLIAQAPAMYEALVTAQDFLSCRVTKGYNPSDKPRPGCDCCACVFLAQIQAILNTINGKE